MRNESFIQPEKDEVIITVVMLYFTHKFILWNLCIVAGVSAKSTFVHYSGILNIMKSHITKHVCMRPHANAQCIPHVKNKILILLCILTVIDARH